MLLKTHWYIWTALLHLFYVRAFNVLIQNVEFATLYLTCTNELAGGLYKNFHVCTVRNIYGVCTCAF